MFYLLVMVHELLLKGKGVVWDSGHFKKDEKEHQWVKLSWNNSAHVILVLLDTNSKYTWGLYASQSILCLTSRIPVSFLCILQTLSLYITLCFGFIGLYFSSYRYRSNFCKQKKVWKERKMFLSRNILVVCHEIMDLSMLIMLCLLLSHGCWTWEEAYIGITLVSCYWNDTIYVIWKKRT